MSVIIPDDILRGSNMTEDELKLEIGILLYEQGKISNLIVSAKLISMGKG